MAHTTRRLAAAAAALALALGVGACGDDGEDGSDGDDAVPSASDPPTGTDDGGEDDGGGVGSGACGLLTTGDVEAALGVPVEVEHDDLLSTDFQDVCNWTSEDLTVGIQVIVVEPGPQADFDVQRETTVEVLGDPDAVEDIEVPGADRAFTLDGLVIAMEIDGAYVQVSNTGIGEASDPVATRRLAELVAGRA